MNKGTKTKTVGFVSFLIMLGALLAFEIVNFSTTEHVLLGIMGRDNFLTLSVATWLAIAFCAADFGGLSRMFTEESNFKKEKSGVKLMTAVWLLAASFNAALTYWYVSQVMTANASYIHPLFRVNADNVAIGAAIFVLLTRFILVSSFAHMMDVGGLNISLPSMPKLPSRKKAQGGGSSRSYSSSPTGETRVTGLPQSFIAAIEEDSPKVL
jgi:uncharacterized membrane protein